MPKDDAPKSAYELAMERLRKKDRDEGVPEHAPTAAQRKAIAEARQMAVRESRTPAHTARSRRAATPPAARWPTRKGF